MNFVETIRAAIDRDDLVPAGANLVVGVSGGADSVALARALQQLELPFTVAHLNHNSRGAESDADERFVRSLGFPTVVKSVDVKALAAETGDSIEMAARRARHDFFAEFDDAVIALGHHADDQVETFLLKLARGAGTDGLGGMSPWQEIGTLRLVRPMLAIPRSAILDWLKDIDQAWREDASNADEAFLRNKIRHAALPMLERELNPNLRGSILRAMDILRAENAWMDSMLEGFSLKDELPLAAKRRLLRKWLFEQGATEAGFEMVESILELMELGTGTKIFELNDRQRVVVEYGAPRFEEGAARKPRARFTVTIERGTGWRKDHGRGAGALPAEASFNAAKVGDAPIEIRTLRAGDRIAPRGLEGSRKLQDILTDQKVPKAERENVPVATCRGEIVWVPGYRVARGWEVADAEAAAVHVKVERNDSE